VSKPRAVVITEASSPVALATAARLAVGGDLVLMGTRHTDICERLATRLRDDGQAAFTAHLDLADPISVDRFVSAADYLIGAVDVLVSAAGLAGGSWVGVQQLAAQIIPPMIDTGRGDVVLISPALAGASPAGAHRMLEALLAGLDAEFVGTGVRASIVRSTGPVPADDVACLIAGAISGPDRMHLRVVDVIPPVPAPTLAQEHRGR
jgi:NAD(P)-dependent dehydrogenase (short-subunit alcohol dehydrogenase family)